MKRLEALRGELARKWPKADALVVAGDENRRYLSGFRGDAGLLWITPTDAALITDSRFWAQAALESPDWRLVRQQGRGAAEFLANLCREAGTSVLAFEPENVNYATYRAWRRQLRGVRLLPASGLVDGLRIRKEAAELAAIRRAAALVDQVFAEWLPLVQPGAVEAELAMELEWRLRRAGAEGMAFPPIVAGGARAAMAHHLPGPERLLAGDLVVVDVGARVDGYCSDMTRTVAVPGATPAPEALQVYDVVRRALEAGVGAVHPGVTGVAVDAAARRVIDAAGYGGHFGHGTGHGVGLAVHEGPRLSPLAPRRARVPEGAVVTVEPGIYLEGRLGVRLEQLVHVTPDGCEILSRAPLQLAGAFSEE